MAENADGTTTAPPPPRRGKFLSGPPPSATTSPPPAKSQTRGKFLNSSISAPNKSTSTSTDGTSTSTTGETTTSLSTLKQQIHQARIVASTRRRAISSSRDEIFNDLEEAETIVLALLQCASEVSEALSKMTMARSRNQIDYGDDDDDGNNGSNNNNNGDAVASFEQLSAQVRLNGVGYLAGVTKLHELLAPHASLVKSYRNHTTTTAGTTVDNANNNNKKLQGAASISDTTTTKTSSEIASFNPNSSEIVNMATSNMYAARVEKRLAVERREILKEMIRLEEERLRGSGNGNGEKEMEGSTLSNNKRKR
mmetsp:Transcript_28049/g.44122  ORF Transcript_28049/g.44122 Transcript_28049/m.44122 type:complete len:310 (+) Transcript_28049:258-1187(+)